MSIVSSIVVYILLWWWVLFMTLPFKARPPEVIEPGHATSAPEKSHIGKKMMITTVISGILFILVYFIITSELISFRELSR